MYNVQQCKTHPSFQGIFWEKNDICLIIAQKPFKHEDYKGGTF